MCEYFKGNILKFVMKMKRYLGIHVPFTCCILWDLNREMDSVGKFQSADKPKLSLAQIAQ